MDFGNRPLGREMPTDFDHVAKYPLRMAARVDKVNKTLDAHLKLRPFYDQGSEGACVGFAASWAKTIIESYGARRTHKFDAKWLYREAQLVDEWDDTPPQEGTSVRAAFDILRDVGHIRVDRNPSGPAHPEIYKVERNEWATHVDQVRACIAAGVPVVIGVNWYSDFDRPVKIGNEYWIGRGDLGRVRGGHAVCIYGALDRKDAVKIVNNWGMEYPPVLMPYNTLQRLLNEYGEATIITDTLAEEVRRAELEVAHASAEGQEA